ncbi:MAG: nuclear transport factor 2 family protein [Cyclobacteriaceae bacterium]
MQADVDQIVISYLQGLEEADLAKILSLFSQEGVVHSPLYGRQKALDFYHRLFADTQQSAITLLHIFREHQKPEVAAAHFRYDWLLRNGANSSFECVDIFYFDENAKIQEMHIIYDTRQTRTAFEKNP